MEHYYDSEGAVIYFDKTILPSGQTIKIEFQEDFYNGKYYYNIYLVEMHKRKQEDTTCTTKTGKDGLKGVMWARSKVEEFEEFLKEIHKGVLIIIFCHWTCNKRRNLYERGISDLGYKYDNIFGYKALCKKIYL